MCQRGSRRYFKRESRKLFMTSCSVRQQVHSCQVGCRGGLVVEGSVNGGQREGPVKAVGRALIALTPTYYVPLGHEH